MSKTPQLPFFPETILHFDEREAHWSGDTYGQRRFKLATTTKRGRPANYNVKILDGGDLRPGLLYAAYIGAAYDGAAVEAKADGKRLQVIPFIQEALSAGDPGSALKKHIHERFDLIEVKGASVNRREELVIGQAAIAMYQSLGR